MGYTFKKGDKIKKKNGNIFSNGQKVNTVSHLSTMGLHVWMEETNSYVDADSVELDCKNTALEEVKRIIENVILKNNTKIAELQDKNKKLGYTLATLNDVDE